MARAKIGKRHRSSNKTRAEKCKRSSYNNYDSSKWNSKLLSAMQYILTSKKYSIPRSTLQDAYSKYTKNQGDVEQFSKHRTQRQILEEEAVVQYGLWASD